MSKPSVLFITPVVPHPAGTGRNLRAWAWVKLLSADHDVHVLVTGRSGQVAPEQSPFASLQFLAAGFPREARWKRRLTLLFPFLVLKAGFASEFQQVTDLAPGTWDWLGGIGPTRIVVFRLYLHDVASLLLTRFPQVPADIDLDDLESHSRFSIARCHARLNRWPSALRELMLAAQYKIAESILLPRYNAIYLAAGEDAGYIRKRFRPRVAAFPNRLAPQSLIVADRPVRILFVGSLGYTPNQEGALLAAEVASHLMQHPDLRVTIAGRGATPAMQRHLGSNRHLDFIESPADLAPLYASALAVMVPLKAGGGTKFKTIEAFAFRRPVISTQEGVRGLNAKPGEHYLAAETADGFAAAITRLAADPALAENIAASGHQLWRRELLL